MQKNITSIESDDKYTYINFNNDTQAIIDTEDMEIFNKYYWVTAKRWDGVGHYLSSPFGGPGSKTIYFHRVVLGVDSNSIDVDHKNHNTLDDRKENLVALPHYKNMQNRKGANSNSTTGVRGVYLHCVLSSSGKECWSYNARVEVFYKNKTKNFKFSNQEEMDSAFEKACKWVEEARVKYMDNDEPFEENQTKTGHKNITFLKGNTGPAYYRVRVKKDGVMLIDELINAEEGIEKAIARRDEVKNNPELFLAKKNKNEGRSQSTTGIRGISYTIKNDRPYYQVRLESHGEIIVPAKIFRADIDNDQALQDAKDYLNSYQHVTGFDHIE